VRRAPRAQVLDHGVDEQAPGAVSAARLRDIEVADLGEVIVEPGGDETDRAAVLLREKERVRVERPLELGLVRLPGHVRPGRRLPALRLPLLPERAQRVEVVGGRVTDGHAGGKRRSPVKR
jgi:hypothetical protein